MSFIDSISWPLVLLLCLTLGLAPFHPPHLWEKFQMLAQHKPLRPIDWFDLALHGAPWLLLLVKLARYGLRGH